MKPGLPVLQIIEIKWLKSARGGQLARDRSRIPKAFPLPAGIGPDRKSQVLIHWLVFSDSNRFAKPVKTQVRVESWNDSCCIDCVGLKQAKEAIRVQYHWSRSAGGAPKRVRFSVTGMERPLRKDVFSVSLGEWGRLEYNGRFSWDEAGWSYKHVVANAGLFLQLSADQFMGSKPVASWADLARLR